MACPLTHPDQPLPDWVARDPVVQKYQALLGALPWDAVPDRPPLRPDQRPWSGPPPEPRAPFVAAYLVKRHEDKRFMSHLRDLVDHPALVYYPHKCRFFCSVALCCGKTALQSQSIFWRPDEAKPTLCAKKPTLESVYYLGFPRTPDPTATEGFHVAATVPEWCKAAERSAVQPPTKAHSTEKRKIATISRAGGGRAARPSWIEGALQAAIVKIDFHTYSIAYQPGLPTLNRLLLTQICIPGSSCDLQTAQRLVQAH